MKLSATRIFGFALAILVCGGLAFALAKPDAVPEPIKARLTGNSNLASFEFLGCSGDWTTEDPAPQVWRTGNGQRTTFLVRHPAECGYSAGTDPSARIRGAELHLDYALVSEGGDLAACLCEYWATFSLKSTPDKIVRVTFDGRDARMMGALAERR